MAKHGVAFDKAHAFGFAEIAALPAIDIATHAANGV